MQFVDKHDNTVPTSDNWRTKVSPIPSFLQKTEADPLLPPEEKESGSPIMKGILYTILTATIGVIVGYVVSFLMRAPSGGTQELYDKAVHNVSAQYETLLGGDKKDGKESSAASTNKSTSPSAPSSPNATAAAAGAAIAPAAPATPVLPKEAAAKPTSVQGADKPKEAASVGAAKTGEAPKEKEAAKEAPKDSAKSPKKPLMQGPVYLVGTNPYGPPPMVEQDLFNPEVLLKVEHDPSNPQPAKAYQTNEDQPTNFQELVQEPSPTPAATVMENDGPTSSFQVQFGAFNSKTNAIQFANRLQEKGYDIGIYEGWTRARGSWYYVRLDRMLDHTGALEITKNIQAREKFLPMVVQPTTQEKKLR